MLGLTWQKQCLKRWPGVALCEHVLVQDGYVILTTQRLIWIDSLATPHAGRSSQLPLVAVHGSFRKTTFGFNPKVRLEIRVYKSVDNKPIQGVLLTALLVQLAHSGTLLCYRL